MDHDLIDGYVSELRRALPWRDDLEDLCAEVEDHLRENVDRLVAQGIEHAEAQRRTLACFGDLGLVARAFAAAPTGGLAVPTQETRRAGVLALAAAAAWLAAIAAAWVGQATQLNDWSLLPYLVFAGTAMTAAALATVALYGLTSRAGQRRSISAAAVVGVGALGTLATGVMAWGWALTTILLTVAAALSLRGLRGLGLNRPASSAMLLLAWPLGAGSLYLLDEVWKVGPLDAYGDHPLAWSISFTLGAGLFAAGLLGYGRWLANEVPADLPAPSSAPLTSAG